MPQTHFIQWDLVWLLKLIAIFEMTFSALSLFLYSYLSALQGWTARPDERQNVLEYKWLVVTVTIVDFGLGSLLAYAVNLEKKSRRPKILLWITFDSLLLPVNIFVLRGMSHELDVSVPLTTDEHLSRAILVHTIYASTHLLFIMAAVYFLAYYTPKIKKYDPSTRPDSVFEPTDPQITTTESRHIRFSESFLQSSERRPQELEPSTSTSKAVQLYRMISADLGFYRMSVLPVLTDYWLRRLSHVLMTPRWRRRRRKAYAGSDKSKALGRALARSDLYNTLAILYEMKKSCNLKRKENLKV